MKIIQVKVEESYFKNIEKAVDSLNRFFSSNFKQKDFPIDDDDDDMDLEPCLLRIMRYLNYINPSWVDDQSEMEDTIEKIHHFADTHNKYSDVMDSITSDDDMDSDMNANQINQYIGYQMCQYISEHQTDFKNLLNGIQTMELFSKPSKYKGALETFEKPIPLDDIEDLIGDNQYRVFHGDEYIRGIFHSSDITLPAGMSQDKELKRFQEREDYPEFEIVKNDEDAPFQEQAEINFFSMVNPNHIRYHQKKFQPSQQFVSVIKNFISGLKTCNTPEDVLEFLNNKKNHVNPDDYTSMVLPSILAKVFANEHQFHNRLFNDKNLKKYMDSYDSILKQDKGVHKFKDYDLLTTFKADKDGTIQFLEDFLSLKLVSDDKCGITNHTLLVMFNIFDSRIYLDILYNVLPNSEKKGEYETEDGFVKAIRARINENSKKSSPYDDHKDTNINPTDTTISTIPTSSEVKEYALSVMRDTQNMQLEDIPYYRNIIQETVHMELKAMGDQAYNVGLSEYDIEQYIGEAALAPYRKKHYLISGRAPQYMQDRIEGLEKSNDKPNTTVEDVDSPEPDAVPTNDIHELINSIEDRVDAVDDSEDSSDLSYGFGADAEVSPEKSDGKIVYNITYNYNNSNNTTTDSHDRVTTTKRDSHDVNRSSRDSHNSSIDRSVNKTTGGTARNVYNPEKKKKSSTTSTKGSNNYNNDTSSLNTKDQYNEETGNETTFSTGKSIQEVFNMLRSEEPLFMEDAASAAGAVVGQVGADTGVLPDMNPEPKESLMVKAQDFDRKLLTKQEKVRRGVQQAGNTARAIGLPFSRAKAWIEDTIDGLIQRDQDQVKYQLMEDKNYRTGVKKAFRIACDLGLYYAAFVISPFIGLLAVGGGALKLADRDRIRKEMRNEFVTEINIIDQKISRAKANKQDDKAHELMRIRSKMIEKAVQSTKVPVEKIEPVKIRNSYFDD